MNPRYKIQWKKIKENWNRLWDDEFDLMMGWTMAITGISMAIVITCTMVGVFEYGPQWNGLYIGTIIGGIPVAFWLLFGLWKLFIITINSIKKIFSEITKDIITIDIEG